MTTEHTFTALRAHERTTAALMADPQIVGDLLLVGLWLSRAVHLQEPAPGEGGWSMRDMAADLFPPCTPLPVGSFNGVPDRPDPDLNLRRIREVVKNDVRRYDPWADLPAGRPKTTPCAGPAARKPVCGKPAYTWSMVTDPATGRRRMLGACRRHIDWYWQERDANRAACEAVAVPRPPANTGGNLARHIDAIDWPALWGVLDPEWTAPPECDSWVRPKLKLLTGDLDARQAGLAEKPRAPRPRFGVIDGAMSSESALALS
jgi:hypothetical protein